MWQRWNGTSKIFEKSTDNGGSWSALDLDAAILTQGTLALARIPVLTSAQLPATVAYTGSANVFTLDQKISKTRPQLQLLHSGTALTRLASWVANNAYFATNLGFDGANWNLDDTGLIGISLTVGSAGLGLTYATAGANPRTPVSLFGVDSAGKVSLPGGQIQYPAAQIASADANCLDDYEEGTFTPVLASSGGGAPAAYLNQVGKYVKVGQNVYVGGRISINGKGTLAAGIAQITGFPFTCDGAVFGSLAVPHVGGLTTSLSCVQMLITAGATTGDLRAFPAGGATATIQLQISDIGAVFDFIFGGVYRATA